MVRIKERTLKPQKMKKVLFSAFAITALSLFSTNICVANSKMNITSSMITATSTRSVAVWKISGAVKQKVKDGGVYDSDSNTITVQGHTYNVQSNPNYGSNNSKGQYQYCAGGVYYFNL